MKTFPPVPVIAAALLLTACGSDPQAASDQSYTAALEAWHAEDPACISLRRQVPIDVLADREAELKAGLDVMAEAGLLKPSTVTRETEPRYGRLRQAEHVRYEPTQAGAEVIRPSSNRFVGGNQLCFGRKRVADVSGYTEPAELGGVRMTRITYTWRLDDVPPWANRPEVQTAFPALAEALAEREGQSTETLVLTESGWKHQSQIG